MSRRARTELDAALYDVRQMSAAEHIWIIKPHRQGASVAGGATSILRAAIAGLWEQKRAASGAFIARIPGPARRNIIRNWRPNQLHPHTGPLPRVSRLLSCAFGDGCRTSGAKGVEPWARPRWTCPIH
jgi:hypothetical protein